MAKKKSEPEADSPEGFLAGVEVREDSPVGEAPPPSLVGEKRPPFTDPAWGDFVMGHFMPDEVVEKDGKKLPKTNALWRVMELLVGNVVGYEAEVVKTSRDSADRCSVVRARVTLWPHAGTGLIPGREVHYDGVGDSTEFNTELAFLKFHPRIAETRAKGRACRTALRLHNTIAFEEVVEKPAEMDPTPLTASQILALDVNAKRINLNVSKWILSECDKADIDFYKYGSISKLPADFGKFLVTKIPGMTAPPGFLGYDPDWRGRRSV